MEELIKIMKIEKKGQPMAPKKEAKVKPKKPKIEKGLKPVAIERKPKVIIEKPKRIKKPKITHIEKKRIKIQENLDAIQAKADAFRLVLLTNVVW